MYSFRPYRGPGVSSAPSENEYQEHFLGVRAASAWGWRPHHLHVPNVMKIWEPKPPGTLWATMGLLRDSFTLHILVCDTRSSGLEYKIHDINSKMKVKLYSYAPWRHSSFGTLALCGGQRSTSTEAALLPRAEPQCPLNRRLVGPHRLSWCFGEVKNLLGFLWNKPLDHWWDWRIVLRSVSR